MKINKLEKLLRDNNPEDSIWKYTPKKEIRCVNKACDYRYPCKLYLSIQTYYETYHAEKKDSNMDKI